MEKGDTSFTVKYTTNINIEDQEYNYDPVSNQRVVDDKFLKIMDLQLVVRTSLALVPAVTYFSIFKSIAWI